MVLFRVQGQACQALQGGQSRRLLESTEPIADVVHQPQGVRYDTPAFPLLVLNDMRLESDLRPGNSKAVPLWMIQFQARILFQSVKVSGLGG